MTPEKPRKTPVQQRSSHTVDAIFEASIQVLTDVGLERLTTTRVAERAGVSIGTLYQYFPNKRSLVFAALERHLLEIVVAVEAACETTKGEPTVAMAIAVIDAFISAKFARPDVSRALYAVAAEVDANATVARFTERSRRAIADMLATASDGSVPDIQLASFLLTTTAIGPVQALLAANAETPKIAAVKAELVAMIGAYLAGRHASRGVSPAAAR